jgi:hypothetical protein
MSTPAPRRPRTLTRQITLAAVILAVLQVAVFALLIGAVRSADGANRETNDILGASADHRPGDRPRPREPARRAGQRGPGDDVPHRRAAAPRRGGERVSEPLVLLAEDDEDVRRSRSSSCAARASRYGR